MKNIEIGRASRLAVAGTLIAMTAVSCKDRHQEESSTEQREEMSRDSGTIPQTPPSRSARLSSAPSEREREEPAGEPIEPEDPSGVNADAVPAPPPVDDFDDHLETVDDILAAIKHPETESGHDK